jgi:hypothetical protein
MMPKLWMVAVLVGVTGSLGACGRPLGKATDPHGHLQDLVAKQNKRPGYFGHLAPGVKDGTQLEELPQAKPTRGQNEDSLAATKDLRLFPLTFVRDDGTQICFHRTPFIGSAAEKEKDSADVAARWTFVARSHRSLDEIAPGSAWPPPGKSTAIYKTPEKDPSVPAAVLEICTPTPPVDAETRFLTVTAIDKDHDYNNFILVWDYEGKLKQP